MLVLNDIAEIGGTTNIAGLHTGVLVSDEKEYG